jgi:hypothetical protein
VRAHEGLGVKLDEAAADDARHAGPEVAEVGAAEEHGPLGGAAVVDVMPASGVVASRASGQGILLPLRRKPVSQIPPRRLNGSAKPNDCAWHRTIERFTDGVYDQP